MLFKVCGYSIARRMIDPPFAFMQKGDFLDS